MQKLKKLAKKLLPPVFIELSKSKNLNYGFFGKYSSWAEAENKCGGYNSEMIFNKVRDAALKVKRGEAAFERDSMAFKEIEYSYPVLSALLMASVKSAKKGFNVLDFGGALGSMYYQYRHLAQSIGLKKWIVVEQERFVEIGKKEFEDSNLKFAFSLKQAEKIAKPDIIILGSVLQYLKEPYKFLDEFLALDAKFILIDRTPFADEGEFVSVQKVSEEIYPAEYPAWFFSEKKILSKMLKNYKIVYSYDCGDSININAKFKGFLLERR